MSVVSEILRFILPKTAANATAFATLRQAVTDKGSVKRQYFGYVLQNEGFPGPKPKDQICWYIEWPAQSSYRKATEFKSALESVTEEDIKSLLFNFTETEPEELVKGLESKVCQFAIISLIDKAPRFDKDLEDSMHKTFTDCYLAKGFTGGGWNYATNSNNADGADIIFDFFKSLPEKETRLAYYVIGWESVEDHHEYARTRLFDIEINKLMPYFAAGSGAFYVKFEKHL